MQEKMAIKETLKRGEKPVRKKQSKLYQYLRNLVYLSFHLVNHKYSIVLDFQAKNNPKLISKRLCNEYKACARSIFILIFIK